MLNACFARVDVGSGLSGFELARFGFVFGSALGLYAVGHEYAVLPQFAVGQRLSAVLKGVRQRVGPGVGDPELGGLLREYELHPAPHALDRAGFHIPPDPDARVVGLVPHLTEFGDGLVIGLVVLHFGRCQPNERADHHHDQCSELAVFLHQQPLEIISITHPDCRIIRHF